MRHAGYKDEELRSAENETAVALCVEARGTPPLSAGCLHDSAYSYVVVFGDSLLRELGWSLARHYATPNSTLCQPAGADYNPLAQQQPGYSPLFLSGEGAFDRKEHHTFRCTVPPSGGSVCAAEHQGVLARLPETEDECCNQHFWQFFQFAPLEGSGELLKMMERLSGLCSCKGLFVANWGLHSLRFDSIAPAIPDPVPWSFPFGRVKGIRDMFQQYTAIAHRERVQLVWASTPRIDETGYMLYPSSGEYRRFAQFSITEQWSRFDRELAANFSVPYLPLYELSLRFRGMQSDGMHWLGSFPVVDDVLSQILLQLACAGGHTRVEVC